MSTETGKAIELGRRTVELRTEGHLPHKFPPFFNKELGNYVHFVHLLEKDRFDSDEIQSIKGVNSGAGGRGEQLQWRRHQPKHD